MYFSSKTYYPMAVSDYTATLEKELRCVANTAYVAAIPGNIELSVNLKMLDKADAEKRQLSPMLGNRPRLWEELQKILPRACSVTRVEVVFVPKRLLNGNGSPFQDHPLGDPRWQIRLFDPSEIGYINKIPDTSEEDSD